MGLIDFLGGGSVSGGSQSAGSLVNQETGLSDTTLRRADVAAGREQQNYGREQGFGRYLSNEARGYGPSTAERQLYAGLDQGQRAASSLQAGATGANAALGRYASILGNANLATQTNQQAAVARAQEQQQAQALYAHFLDAMAKQNLGLYGTNLSTGASTLESAAQQQAAIEQENANRRARVIGSLLSAGGQLGAAALGGPPAAAAVGAAPMSPGAAYAAAQPGLAASQTAGPAPGIYSDSFGASPAPAAGGMTYGGYLADPYSRRDV